MKKIVIIGCGNPLLKDEGFGSHVAEELLKMKLPENVRVCDAGTGGLAILGMFKNADKVIIIDSMKLGLKPGTIKKFSLKNLPEPSALLSWPHEWDLTSILKLGEGTRKLPREFIVIGVEAKEVDKYGIGLSGKLRTSKKKVIGMILNEIKQN